MLNKLNNKVLIVVLVVLVAIVAYNFLTEEQTSTFKKKPVSLDSASVTKIVIKRPGKEALKLNKVDDDRWNIQAQNKKDKASIESIVNMITTLQGLKSQSIVANKASQYKQYKVDDSSGTRVTIYEGDSKASDLYVGKFDFDRKSRSATSYIRLADEKNVYSVNGYLGRTFKKSFNDLRYKKLVKGDKNRWEKVEFKYPEDSGFVLSKTKSGWNINTNDTIDSTQVESYLSKIENLEGQTFIDNYSVNGKSPVMQVKISGKNMSKPLEIMGYPADSTHQLAITSNYNKSVFSGKKSNLIDKVFISPENLEEGNRNTPAAKRRTPQMRGRRQMNPQMRRKMRQLRRRKMMQQQR